ncbi:MAG: hypothetical protein HRT88_18475 [Lentisphaeraceae bacterium]|nr:hypothetical protein [Lentisphaeraceae bacterium]
MSGIFREVKLYAAAQVHLRDFFAQTGLKNDYRDGTLKLSGELVNFTSVAKDATLHVKVLDKGRLITQDTISFNKIASKTNFSKEYLLPAIKSWNAEKPYLYTLLLSLKDESSQTIEAYSCRLGFRNIAIGKNLEVLVNGR